jgi:hypothetical protein
MKQIRKLYLIYLIKKRKVITKFFQSIADSYIEILEIIPKKDYYKIQESALFLEMVAFSFGVKLK